MAKNYQLTTTILRVFLLFVCLPLNGISQEQYSKEKTTFEKNLKTAFHIKHPEGIQSETNPFTCCMVHLQRPSTKTNPPANSRMRSANNACELLPQQTNLVLGGRKMIIIRGVDPATHTWKDTDAEIETFKKEMDDYLKNISFGRAWMEKIDVTPVYNFTVNPNNKGFSSLGEHLNPKAESSGYRLDDYNVVMYIHQSSTDFGGAGALGAGNGAKGTVWANNNLTYYFAGNIHETLHGFGVGHAEGIEGGNTMYPGANTGGNDPYFFMGSQGDAGMDTDIPNYMKYFLGFIKPENVTCVPSELSSNCLTHRIYKASLVPTLNSNHQYAIQVGSNLWLSYEPDNKNSRIEKKGVLLHYIPGKGSAVSKILDTRPNSITELPSGIGSNYKPVIDFWDAAMEVGDKVNWGNMEINVVNTGGSGNEKWVDIEFCNCILSSGDDDNDGVCNSEDTCPQGDDTKDKDFDGIPDFCDTCPSSTTNDSNNDGICDNDQCLNKVIENFDYAIDSELVNSGGGDGFDGAWTYIKAPTGTSITAKIKSGDLSTSNTTSGGNKLGISLRDESEGISFKRNLSQGFTNGETVWVSALIRANKVGVGSIWIKPDNRQEIAIGKKWGNKLSIDDGNATSVTMETGQTYWLVAKYVLKPTETVIQFWVNPSESELQAGTTPDATKITNRSQNGFSSIAIGLSRYGEGDYELDALQMLCKPPSASIGQTSCTLDPGTIIGDEQGCPNFNPMGFEGTRAQSSSGQIEYTWERRTITECGGTTYGPWGESPNNIAFLNVGPFTGYKQQWRRGARVVGCSSEYTFTNVITLTSDCEKAAGKSCDDGDVCTINDVYDNNCNCKGTFQDSDNDGICDAQDTSCNDQDGDGICDTEDCAPNDANYPKPTGTACNDGNPNTVNDKIQGNGCDCQGTIIDSPNPNETTVSCDGNTTITYGNGTITMSGQNNQTYFFQIFDKNWREKYVCGWQCGSTKTVDLPAGEYRIYIKNDQYQVICEKVIILTGGSTPIDNDNDGVILGQDCDDNDANVTTVGATCNDGNPNTVNDKVQANCQCIGSPIALTYDCPGLAANIGDTCNDNNPNTSNDKVQANCTCAGTPNTNSGNMTTESCGNGTITYGNGEITMEGAYFYHVFDLECNEIFVCGSECGATQMIENLPAGDYQVLLRDYTYQVICDKIITLTSGTTTENPNSGATVNCGEVTITHDAGTVNLMGQAGKSYYFKINDMNNGWKQVFGCTWNCGHQQEVTNLPNSKYLVTVYNEDWSRHCREVIDITNSNFTQRASSRTTKTSNASLNEEIETISMFPNPATNRFTLDLKSIVGKTADISIINTNGEVIHHLEIKKVPKESVRIPLEVDISNGIYLVFIELNGQKPLTKKLLVTK